MSEEERDTISGIVGSREKGRGRWPTWSSMKKRKAQNRQCPYF